MEFDIYSQVISQLLGIAETREHDKLEVLEHYHYNLVATYNLNR